MPIETPHPDYTKNIRRWRRCRDVVAGEDAVKDSGDAYLPRLSGQDNAEYEAYKMRASFFGASARTVGGLAGAILRKPPDVEFPDEELLKEIGGEGTDEQLLAKQVVEEVLTTGRCGLYVDAPAVTGDAAAMTEPYVCLYKAEDITNWREAPGPDGEPRLTLVVLRERETVVDEKDSYLARHRDRYRELFLDGGVFKVRVWTERALDGPQTVNKYEAGPEIIPARRGGKSFDYIPFLLLTPHSVAVGIEKSPILDLANINLSHYRTSADLEHGRHYTALPTAWAAGFDAKETKLKIGSSVAWVSDNPQARAGYLEFSGAGLNHLKEGLDQKETQMSVLGARLLEQQKRGVESADTIEMRHEGEKSLLSSIAQTVSDGLTKILTWCAEWIGASGDSVKCELNRKFAPGTMDAVMLANLMTALQNGSMSFDVFYYNLERADMYPDDWTEEEERAAIADGSPMPSPGTPLPGGDIQPDPKLQTQSDQLDLEQKKAALKAAQNPAPAA